MRGKAVAMPTEEDRLRHDIERHIAICAEQAKRIEDLEAALRGMLQYAYLDPIDGVVYACGAHRDVMRRAERLLETPEK